MTHWSSTRKRGLSVPCSSLIEVWMKKDLFLLVLNVLICYMIPDLFPLLFPPFLHVAWQFWDPMWQ